MVPSFHRSRSERSNAVKRLFSSFMESIVGGIHIAKYIYILPTLLHTVHIFEKYRHAGDGARTADAARPAASPVRTVGAGCRSGKGCRAEPARGAERHSGSRRNSRGVQTMGQLRPQDKSTKCHCLSVATHINKVPYNSVLRPVLQRH